MKGALRGNLRNASVGVVRPRGASNTHPCRLTLLFQLADQIAGYNARRGRQNDRTLDPDARHPVDTIGAAPASVEPLHAE